jgi:hypothetical protein
MSARISYLLPGNERKKNEPVCLVAIDAGRKLEIPVLFLVGNKLENLFFL